MSDLQKILGVLVALVTILGAVGKVWNDARSDAVTAAIENDRLHREVHQLRHILISEFPDYTESIDWSDK